MDGAFEDLQAHGVSEVLAGVEDGGGIAGEAQGAGHGIPTEAVEVNAHAGVNGLFHAGEHVRIAGDQDDVADVALHGCEDHVRDQSGIHGLLGAPIAPLDQLTGAQLHARLAAQGTLVAVRAGIGDAVIPVLPMDLLLELFRSHPSEHRDNLG